MLFNLTKLLNEPVGNNLENDIEDIKNTKEKFKAIGAYEPPVRNGYIDRELDDAIFEFQKEKNLKSMEKCILAARPRQRYSAI